MIRAKPRGELSKGTSARAERCDAASKAVGMASPRRFINNVQSGVALRKSDVDQRNGESGLGREQRCTNIPLGDRRPPDLDLWMMELVARRTISLYSLTIGVLYFLNGVPFGKNESRIRLAFVERNKKSLH